MNSSSVVLYFTGDCKALDDFIAQRYGPFWGLVKYLNALFRGVGQVVFANNPWSGIIILASLYWASILVGFATTVAATTAILTAIVFKQEESKITSGSTTYCAVLVGSVTASIWEPVYGEPVSPKLWGFIILAAALSVLVNAALVNILGSFKPPIPSFTLAFNIVTILVFTVLQPRPTTTTGRENFARDGFSKIDYEMGKTRIASIFSILSEGSGRVKDGNGNTQVEIISVIEGIMLSMGQVYGVQHLKGSIAMYIATILYSPTVCVLSIVGATVASFFGLVFAGPTFQNVYDGIWGYNAILASIAVGAFFFVPTSVSFALAVADVALVVLIQMALTISFTPLKLPVLTFPFVISTIFFLEVTATGDILTRVKKFSYPEQHLREFIAKKKKEKEELQMMNIAKSIISPSAPLLPFYYTEATHDKLGYSNPNYSHVPQYSQYPRQVKTRQEAMNPSFLNNHNNTHVENFVNHQESPHYHGSPHRQTVPTASQHFERPWSAENNQSSIWSDNQKYNLKRR